MGFHRKKHLPAFDRPLTGQIPGFPATVGKIELMSKPRTPDFQMIARIHGTAPYEGFVQLVKNGFRLNLQKNTPVLLSYLWQIRGPEIQHVQKQQNRQGKNRTFPGGSV
jgi:hypothetical protein